MVFELDSGSLGWLDVSVRGLSHFSAIPGMGMPFTDKNVCVTLGLSTDRNVYATGKSVLLPIDWLPGL